jgi:hypothetical protein
MPKLFDRFRKTKYKIIAAGVAALIAKDAHTQTTNRIARQPIAIATRAKPVINFHYCDHDVQRFNWSVFLSTLKIAQKHKTPFNTLILEAADITAKDKRFIEQSTDLHHATLKALSDRFISLQNTLKGRELGEARLKIIKKCSLLCGLENPFHIGTILYAYQHGVKHICMAEQMTPEEILLHSKINKAPTGTATDQIIRMAYSIRIRNTKMAGEIINIINKSKKDPRYMGAPLKALVLSGAAHGGMTDSQGIHDALNAALRAHGKKATIEYNIAHGKLISGTPSNYQTALAFEAQKLAQKPANQMAQYRLPQHLESPTTFKAHINNKKPSRKQ